MKNDISRYFYGPYGGRFVPETLIPALEEVEKAFFRYRNESGFKKELSTIFKYYVGRPTPLYFAKRLSQNYRARIYLKREDLCHTGSHKINNAVGQALLAKRLRKTRLIAETGAGQHGVATATVAAHFGFKCSIFMGTEDVRRQALNVYRMKLLGAQVREVDAGSKTLKDAINEAMRNWTETVLDTHYLFGSVLGPYPFPMIVRHFQSVIGEETRKQIRLIEKKDPDYVLACVGGGSNSIGIFSPFLSLPGIQLIGVEAGGIGKKLGLHAARFFHPEKGVFQGSLSYVLQQNGQIYRTHSIAAGLDYPSIGPEHALLHDLKKVKYDSVNDDEAVHGFKILSAMEGIIPALESSHAVGYLEKIKHEIINKLVVINLSGRGDKDCTSVIEHDDEKRKKP
ncbi:MAG: tryptophan synthase subunit beta [Candidatus Aureabacteria bacterium]|nr:tryptophan synthase subunit beta [Candidatus Auribacterota bacterium]